MSPAAALVQLVLIVIPLMLFDALNQFGATESGSRGVPFEDYEPGAPT